MKTVIKLGIVTVLSLAFMNCGRTKIVEVEPDGRDTVFIKCTGTVSFGVDVGKVGSLAKVSAINLDKLVLKYTSSASDTVVDTLTLGGGVGPETVPVSKDLMGLRDWTINAKVLDSNDSVTHSTTSSVFTLNPGDSLTLSTLNMSSLFTMYEANIGPLPDSISSSTPGTGKDVLKLNRFVLRVDGVIKKDSLVSPSFFTSGQVVKLTFDYVPVGSHTVKLEGYGVQNNFTGLLYEKTLVVNLVAGQDSTINTTMDWVGPTTGNSQLNVVIGKVGKATVNGSLPGTVIP